MDKKPGYELSVDEMALIEGYLCEELSPADREAFDRRMDTDPAWRDKIGEVKYLILGVREANLARELIKWRTDLLSDKRILTPPIQPSILLSRWWWVAASVALLVMGSLWIFGSKTDTPEQLYQAFYEPDIGLPVEMSVSEEGRYRFYDGMISYKEENYADALAKWEGFGAEVMSSDTLSYYRAMAHMGQGDFSAAASLLSGMVSDRHSVFHTDALWYLALSHLRQGEKEEAIAQLNKIPHDERAQQLLNRLE